MARAPREGTLLICATPRCGSTYFCGLLRQTEAGGWPGEWLGRAGEQHFRELYGLPETAGFGEFVQALRETRCGQDGTFSVKAMWPHLVQFVARGREAAGFDESVSDRAVLEHFLGPLKFLYLYREDTVGQAISLARAVSTRLWHQLSEKGHYIELPAPYDPAAIYENLRWIRYHNRLWRYFFHRSELAPVERRFEDFIKAPPDRLMAETLAELGLGPVTGEVGREKPTRRQSDGLTREWRQRFEAHLARREAFPGSVHDAPYPASAFQLELILPEIVLRARQGEISLHPLRIRNPGPQTWMEVGDGEGNREARLQLRLTTDRGETRTLEQALTEPLEAGRTTEVELILPEDLPAGLHALSIDLERRGEGTVSARGGRPASGHLWVEADTRLAEAADYFGSPCPADRHETLEHPWLGPLRVAYFPWVRHAQLEWFRVSGTGVAGDDYWCFFPDVGLLWTSERLFPRFWLPGGKEFLTYAGLEANAKVFVREATGERFEVKSQAHELPFRADPLFA